MNIRLGNGQNLAFGYVYGVVTNVKSDNGGGETVFILLYMLLTLERPACMNQKLEKNRSFILVIFLKCTS